MADVPIAYNSYRVEVVLKLDALCIPVKVELVLQTINSVEQTKYNTSYEKSQGVISKFYNSLICNALQVREVRIELTTGQI